LSGNVTRACIQVSKTGQVQFEGVRGNKVGHEYDKRSWREIRLCRASAPIAWVHLRIAGFGAAPVRLQDP
jgi:hypothetical protein